jgi:tRNA(fMet)-specific endonuclease VapC
MKLYIFDTDHLSLYGRNHQILMKKLLTNKVKLVTTAISVEESLRGRLAQVAEAKNSEKESNAYQRLIQTVQLLSEFQILPYDEKCREIYQKLKISRIRVGSQDLKIASIVLNYQGILLTRNIKDFEKIPSLSFKFSP